MKRKILVLIPARGGSKGLPGKNIRLFRDKPLLLHTIDFAKKALQHATICVSTDSLEIREVAQRAIEVPFLRPVQLATDSSGTYEVIMHALEFYKGLDIYFDFVLLLQPTTPYRCITHLEEILNLEFDENTDMIVSVNETTSNPYYNLFEEDDGGYILKSKAGNYTRRQDCPKIYEINGAYYFIRVKSLQNGDLSSFSKIKKYVIDNKKYYLDIDDEADWNTAVNY